MILWKCNHTYSLAHKKWRVTISASKNQCWCEWYVYYIGIRSVLNLRTSVHFTWEVGNGATWEVGDGTTWDVEERTTWDIGDGTTWDVGDGTTWDIGDWMTWDVGEGTTWDVGEGTTWDVGEGTTWDVGDETTWDVGDGTTFHQWTHLVFIEGWSDEQCLVWCVFSNCELQGNISLAFMWILNMLFAWSRGLLKTCSGDSQHSLRRCHLAIHCPWWLLHDQHWLFAKYANYFIILLMSC